MVFVHSENFGFINKIYMISRKFIVIVQINQRLIVLICGLILPAQMQSVSREQNNCFVSRIE